MKVERSEDSAIATELSANGLFVGRAYYSTRRTLEKKIEGLSPADVQKLRLASILDPKKLTIIHAGDFKKKRMGNGRGVRPPKEPGVSRGRKPSHAESSPPG